MFKLFWCYILLRIIKLKWFLLQKLLTDISTFSARFFWRNPSNRYKLKYHNASPNLCLRKLHIPGLDINCFAFDSLRCCLNHSWAVNSFHCNYLFYVCSLWDCDLIFSVMSCVVSLTRIVICLIDGLGKRLLVKIVFLWTEY